MKQLKLVVNVATSVLVVVALALVAVVYAIPTFLGGASLVVTTGSMRPTISPGDLIAVEAVDPAELRIGDIITFSYDNELVTHRVVGTTSRGTQRAVITQGDANPNPDPPVAHEQVRGRVVYSVPHLGRVLPHLRPALPYAIGAVAVFFAGSLVLERRKKKLDAAAGELAHRAAVQGEIDRAVAVALAAAGVPAASGLADVVEPGFWPMEPVT